MGALRDNVWRHCGRRNWLYSLGSHLLCCVGGEPELSLAPAAFRGWVGLAALGTTLRAGVRAAPPARVACAAASLVAPAYLKAARAP